MVPSIQSTNLWKNSLERANQPDAVEKAKDKLRVALTEFRSRVETLVARISSAFPQLTVHDVTHLDALWETADLIAGEGYPLNPMEAFVFGGAILLHDAAHCFEAYAGGRDEVRQTIEWKDSFAAERERSPDSLTNELETSADFMAVRLLHAKQASELAVKPWENQSGGDKLYLIELADLRNRYGQLIGEIAASHNWNIDDVASKFRPQVNAPGGFPSDWRVDPVKIACLLRCADAGHIDDRRSPDFLYALLRRSGISADHWKAQNWLGRLDVDQSDSTGESALVTSTHPFSSDDSTAWWIAYDAIDLLDREIRASNSLLQSRAQQKTTSPPFKIRRITGAGSPSELCKFIEVKNWKPTHAILHVGNVQKLVQTLGGRSLYGETGDDLGITLRELLQNARDATAARKAFKDFSGGKITIRLRPGEANTSWLDIEDDGVGMSERVLTDALLDFGNSFWASDLVKSEFPGLKASGFRPIGKYGIGFYAAFMSAKQVEVSSRRFGEGLDDVRRLLFKGGLSLRPVVSKGAPDFFNNWASTCVSVQIDGNIDSCRKKKIKAGVQDKPDIEIPIESYLAAIVTGLDVKVEFQFENNAPTLIHRPIDTSSTEAAIKKWFKIISFSEYQSNPPLEKYIEDNATRLRAIPDTAGEIVGVAAIYDTPPVGGFPFTTTQTVGGLLGNVQRGGGGYFGYLDYKPNTAKRDASIRRASDADMQRWGDDQITILKEKKIDEIQWHWVSNNLAGLGVDPLPVLRVPIVIGGRIGLLTMPNLFEILKSTPIAYFKMNTIDLIEQNMPVQQFGNLPTYRPLSPGSLLSAGFENGRPKDKFGFPGCVDRYATQIGRRVSYVEHSGAAIGSFGPVDAVVISLDKSA